MKKEDLGGSTPRINVGTLGSTGAGKTTLTAALIAVSAQKQGTALIPPLVAGDSASSVAAHVEYVSGERQYDHVDIAGHPDQTKALITHIAQLDAAILVVSIMDGPQPRTREQVLLARSLGLPDIVVFLNKADLLEDADLLDLVELEVRELLTQYGFAGDEVPVVVGSALKALEGDVRPIGVPSVAKLLEVMDTFIPLPDRDVYGDFIMAVESAAPLEQGDTLVTGRIERGSVGPKDSVEVVGDGRPGRATVVRVERSGEPLEWGQAGESVSLVLRGIGGIVIKPGQVLCKPGTIQAHNQFDCEVYLLTPDEGASDSPFSDDFHPSFHFWTIDVPGTVRLAGGAEQAMPGARIGMSVNLSRAIPLHRGQRFSLHDNDRIVGTGLVTWPGGPLLLRSPGIRDPAVDFDFSSHLPSRGALPAAAEPGTAGEPSKWIDTSTAREVSLLFVTTRKASEDPGEIFSGERAVDVTYGKANVRVPDERELGTVCLPFRLKVLSLTLYRQKPNPRKHFILKGYETLEKRWWLRTVAAAHEKEALIFVHGFNVDFRAGVFRCAQIAWDIDYKGIPILFSWASRGKLLDYGYDRNSALLARAPFAALLRDLREVGVERVHVVAHSMGNFAVLEALANHDHASQPLCIGEIIMAAPDVDSDQYRQIAPKVRAVAQGMTLYASSADKAMVISKGLAGRVPRAGDVLDSGPVLVDEIDAIDVTAVGDEILGLNHGVFATGKSILNDVKLLLSKRIRPPGDRLAEIRGMPEGQLPSKWWRYVR